MTVVTQYDSSFDTSSNTVETTTTTTHRSMCSRVASLSARPPGTWPTTFKCLKYLVRISFPSVARACDHPIVGLLWAQRDLGAMCTQIRWLQVHGTLCSRGVRGGYCSLL